MDNTIHPWQETEIALSATRDYDNAYTQVEAWADFTHSDGTILRRPAFWDGGRTWKIRFASPHAIGEWTYQTSANVDDAGLQNQSGVLHCTAAEETSNRFYQRGFWRMSPGKRNLIYADGTPVCWWAIRRGRFRGAPRLSSAASTRKTDSAKVSTPRC
jgi:hypothetical protein